VQVAYKNASKVLFHSVSRHKTQTFFKQRVEELKPLRLRLSAAYVNQSLKNWIRSASYMCVSFVNLLRGWCLSAKSLLGFDRACAGVHQKRVNVKSAIIMAGTMISYTNAILAAKAYCRSYTYGIEFLTCVFAGNFYEQMVAFIQSRS